MHNGSCQGVIGEKKVCPLHKDYEKTRSELIKLFGESTINDLVRKAKNKELITI